jgi:NitT/TauT family transport system permease protein
VLDAAGPRPAARRPSAERRSAGAWATALRLPTVALAALLAAAWWYASSRLSPLLLPAPDAVAGRLADLAAGEELWRNAWATLWRIGLGFAAASVVSTLLGFLAAQWRVTRQVIEDVNSVLNATSVFVWIVLAVVWFGLSDVGPIFTTFMITLPIVLSTVVEGVANVDRRLLDMGRVYQLGAVQRFLHITLPATVPYLVSGMRVGLGIGLKVSVVAEIFGVSSGIGYQMNQARETLDTAAVFAWAFVLIAIMLAVDKLLFGRLSRMVASWQ